MLYEGSRDTNDWSSFSFVIKEIKLHFKIYYNRKLYSYFTTQIQHSKQP